MRLEAKAGLDEELQDLKLRFELLEGDRKAYYETSQWAIRQNKDEIGKLRTQNKDLADQIAKIKKHELDSASSRVSTDALEKFEHKICEVQKKYDDMQAEARNKEERLREMGDQLDLFRREAEMVKSNVQDSPAAKEIRTLENRLDKATIKYNEAQSIRKTYEQITRKLQDERLTFDKQIEGFERTLRAKRHDASDLEAMSRDANHAKEVAKAELARFEAQINEERKQREKDLTFRKEMVKHQMELADKLNITSMQMEDPTAESALPSSESKPTRDDTLEQAALEFEHTLRVIQEATGASDISEVSARFQAQQETKSHLISLQRKAESRVDSLKQEHKEAIKELGELKYSGESRTAQSAAVVADFEGHLSVAEVKCGETRGRYERLSRLLNDARSGTQHLCDKLEGIQMAEKTPMPAVSDDTVASVLEVCVAKLETLISSLQQRDIPDPATVASQVAGEPVGILQVGQSGLPPYNTRVKLRPLEFEPESAEDEDENDDDFAEVPDRETLKKHTAQLLASRSKGAKAPKKSRKGKKDGDDDEE
ncbi:hypothetical protein SmJEL517_g04325 [Synchytrium microbalum]|uniref:ODAD1 central coiled coil region domain-containing protein n=1 Tax=Synchytrium microbalum TaxID=1806994 RepID=A0A507BYV4_9FUNG|nr:uncharacterized protein SmJEL517_g04325 [Synchytrium microbalum]TPX32612.1 hypothetical protein SmJEL517_g04325 [Synchytrium microbalum]